MRVVRFLLAFVSVVAFAAACGGSDSADDDDDVVIEVEQGGDEPGSTVPSTSVGTGGSVNPLCPTADIASPPPGFPFEKPADMYVIAYDEPAGSDDYAIRGVTTDSNAVADQLMQEVFPTGAFTATSDREGSEAYDFETDVGAGDFFFVTFGDCTNVQINLRMESSGAGASDATSGEAVSESASDEAASGGVDPTTTVASEASNDAPSVTVLTEDGTFKPTVQTCRINSTSVEIVASGDGELQATGADGNVDLTFTPPGGAAIETSEPLFGNAPGQWQFITSTGILIEAKGCDS